MSDFCHPHQGRLGRPVHHHVSPLANVRMIGLVKRGHSAMLHVRSLVFHHEWVLGDGGGTGMFMQLACGRHWGCPGAAPGIRQPGPGYALSSSPHKSNLVGRRGPTPPAGLVMMQPGMTPPASMGLSCLGECHMLCTNGMALTQTCPPRASWRIHPRLHHENLSWWS